MDLSVILTEQRTNTDPVREAETEKNVVESHVRLSLFSSTERPLSSFALQPIPLDFLRLGPFIGPPEQHKGGTTAETSSSNRVLGSTHPTYPFIVFHAATLRRETLYASSEAERNKWKEVLEETKNLRDAHMDGNKVRWGSILSGSMNSAFIDVLLTDIWFQCHPGRAFPVTDDTSSFEHGE